MTIRPQIPCVIIRRTESFDRTGRATYSAKRLKTKCDIIWAKEGAQITTVRADSSASRGRADEEVNDARLLFHAREQLRLGDVVEIPPRPGRGYPGKLSIEINLIQRRVDVSGAVHHIEVEGMRHEEEAGA
jgi:hypothetical protein